MSKQKIIPNLWFDDQAEEAAQFYTSLFEHAGIGEILRYQKAGQDIHGKEEGSVMTVEFELEGLRIIGLNGGPQFKFTPAISFYVTLESEDEVDSLWNAFLEGGEVMMPLDKYEWSNKYGWIKDKFGLTWQIALGKLNEVHRQKVIPLLMYVTETGQAEEAVNLYTSLFKNSKIDGILKYGKDDEQPEGTVMHTQFSLDGEMFMAMDTNPKFADFTFNESISLLVDCENQDEIDHFWEKLSEGGDPKAQVCGWLKDKFGVSWQIVPKQLNEMLRDSDPNKVARVTDCFMKMKKLDLNELREVYLGEAS